MKNILTFSIVLFAALSLSAQKIEFNPKTGDIEMDDALKGINDKAEKDVNDFKKDMNSKFKLAGNKVDEMLKIMSPGDVYMAAQTAEATKKPIEKVSETYLKNKDKGWGATAKELGIKPGSKEFHAMKDKSKKHNADKGKGNEQGNGNGKGKDKSKDKAKAKGKGKDIEKVNNETPADKPAPQPADKPAGTGKGKG